MTTTTTEVPTVQPVPTALVRNARQKALTGRLIAAYLDRWGERGENTSLSHPYAATMLTFSLGAAAHAAQLPAAEAAGAGALGVIAATVLAARHADAGKHGPVYRKLLIAHSVLSSMGAAAMATWADMAGPFDPAQLATLGIGAVASGGLYAILRAHESRAAVRIAERQRVEQRIAEQEAIRVAWNKIFTALQLRKRANGQVTGLSITHAAWAPNRAAFQLELEDLGMGITTSQMEGATSRIATMASREFGARYGWTISAQSISVEETEDAHRWVLWVRIKDALKGRSLPYVLEEGVCDFADPLPLGLYETGEQALVTFLGSNAQVVGGMGSGKSVLLNNVIGRALECDNVVVWICGTDKAVPLAFPWIRPWLAGHSPRPAIDWVAGEHLREVHAMLAAALRVARNRNKVKRSGTRVNPTREFPALLVILEEASSALDGTPPLPWMDVDGVEKENTCSELLKQLLQINRSANVPVALATQYGLQAALGDDGTFMRRNINIRIVLKVNAPQDADNVLTVKSRTQDAVKLRDNTFYVQPNVDEQRVHRTKTGFLESEEDIWRVEQHTVARRARLDQGAVKAAGAPYSGRWRPDLNSEMVMLAADDGVAWPEWTSDGDSADWQPPTVREHQLTSNEIRGVTNQVNRAMARADLMDRVEGELLDTLPQMWRDLHDGALSIQTQVPEGKKYFATTAWLAECVGAVTTQDDETGVRKFGQRLSQFGLESERPERGGPRGYRLGTIILAAEQMAVGRKTFDPADTDAMRRAIEARLPH